MTQWAFKQKKRFYESQWSTISARLKRFHKKVVKLKKIMKMLGKKELCVCEITAILGLAQPTVSKHLKVLEGAGLVDFQKDGLWGNYRLTENHDSSFRAAMQKHLTDWLSEDPEVRKILAKTGTIDREKICAP